MFQAQLDPSADPRRKPQSRLMEPNEDNHALYAEYQALTRKINSYPARLAGLGMTFRKRDWPTQKTRLAAERAEDIVKFRELEKQLGFDP